MTNLVERHVEEYQQVRGQRGLLDRASIDIGRLVSVSEEARHFTLTVRSVLRDLLPHFPEARTRRYPWRPIKRSLTSFSLVKKTTMGILITHPFRGYQFGW